MMFALGRTTSVPRMIELGLTGGIGSGKSTVAEMLVSLGAVLIDADVIVHELQAPGTPVLAAMADRFGGAIVRSDGSLDRRAVADIVFSDPAALEDLNAIVHPAVSAEMQGRREALADTDATVILDIPLLVESRYDGLAGIVVVDLPEELQVERLVAFRRFDPDDARARVDAQVGRAERLARADFVIDNSGDLVALTAEVDRCWAWIATLPRPAPGGPVEPIRGRVGQR